MSVIASAELTDGVPTQWFPIDHGFLSWNYDPHAAVSTITLTPAGTLTVVALKVNGGLVSKVTYDVTTAGVTLTTGESFVALYQNGVLLGSSADQSVAWASAGIQNTSLVSPVFVPSGIVYAAFVYSGTTGPTLAAAATPLGNVGFLAASARYGTANTGVTTSLPASLATISALSAHEAPWVAVS